VSVPADEWEALRSNYHNLLGGEFADELREDQISISGVIFRPAASGGNKNQKESQLSSAPLAGLTELGKVCALGADKYGRENYRGGYPIHLNIDALYRHLLAFQNGEDLDPESGVTHLAHVAWHALAMIQILEDHPECDDRYKARYEGQAVDYRDGTLLTDLIHEKIAAAEAEIAAAYYDAKDYDSFFGGEGDDEALAEGYEYAYDGGSWESYVSPRDVPIGMIDPDQPKRKVYDDELGTWVPPWPEEPRAYRDQELAREYADNYLRWTKQHGEPSTTLPFDWDPELVEE
jgi:hypothetical protein